MSIFFYHESFLLYISLYIYSTKCDAHYLEHGKSILWNKSRIKLFLDIFAHKHFGSERKCELRYVTVRIMCATDIHQFMYVCGNTLPSCLILALLKSVFFGRFWYVSCPWQTWRWWSGPVVGMLGPTRSAPSTKSWLDRSVEGRKCTPIVALEIVAGWHLHVASFIGWYHEPVTSFSKQKTNFLFTKWEQKI